MNPIHPDNGRSPAPSLSEEEQRIADAVRATITPGHTDMEIVRMSREANRATFFRYLSILSVIGLLVVSVLAIRASDDAKEATGNVRSNQIANCQAAISPGGARYIQADGLQREENRSQALNLDKRLTAQAFGISVEQLEAVQAQQRQDTRDQIQSLLDIDCSTGRALPRHTPNYVPPQALGQ